MIAVAACQALENPRVKRVESVPPAQVRASSREQCRRIQPLRIDRVRLRENGLGPLEGAAVEEHRAQVRQDERVVRRQRERAPEARLGAIVIAPVMQADAVIDPEARVGIGRIAQLALEQCGGFAVCSVAAQRVNEVTLCLPVTGFAAQHFAPGVGGALRLPVGVQREGQVVHDARVAGNDRQRMFVGGDRGGELPLSSMQVAELEGRVGECGVALHRTAERGFRRVRVTVAQRDTQQRPHGRVVDAEGHRPAAQGFRRGRVAACPRGVRIANRDTASGIVRRGH